MSNQPSPELKAQALLDLTTRARDGIVIYLATWLTMSWWYDIGSISPSLFWTNTLILVLFAVVRIFHYRQVTQHGMGNVDVLTNFLKLLVLANGLHWGILVTWLISFPEYQEIHYPSITILAAFALGGTSNLSISRQLRILYPLFVAGPPVLTQFIIRIGPEYDILAILALVALVYIFDAARLSGEDYWNALRNQQIAQRNAKQLEKLSVTDPLTGLHNRLYFNKRYREEWKRCQRQGTTLAVLMIDLDHFKQINDNHGHFFGDECLMAFAKALQQQVSRETDVIARYGGEEFIAMLPDTSLPDAQRIAQNLLTAVENIELEKDGQPVSMTCSIGIACTHPDLHQHEESLLHAADHALYTAKANGRNQCVAANQK